MKQNWRAMVLIGLGCLVFCLSESFAENQTESFLSQLEKDVFTRINHERQDKGLPYLIWREDVARAARSHSSSMGTHNYFSHDDPVEGDLKKRISKRVASRWSLCGENILKEPRRQDPVQMAVEGWMNSPRHRDNILNPSFTHTGIGVVRGRDNSLIITQDFILAR